MLEGALSFPPSRMDITAMGFLFLELAIGFPQNICRATYLFFQLDTCQGLDSLLSTQYDGPSDPGAMQNELGAVSLQPLALGIALTKC